MCQGQGRNLWTRHTYSFQPESSGCIPDIAPISALNFFWTCRLVLRGTDEPMRCNDTITVYREKILVLSFDICNQEMIK